MNGYSSTFEMYMLFRMTEEEHIEKAYNKGSNSLKDADSNGISQSGENHDTN